MGQQEIPTAYEKQLVALGRVLQTLREEENIDVLIETTLNYLQTEFDYPLIWIGLYDRLYHRLLGKGGITPTGDTTLLKQRFFLNPGDLMEQVVIEQRPVGVPDLREEVRAGEWRRAAQQFGIQGTLLFPLRCKDRCFGVALLGSQDWGTSPRAAEKTQMSLLFGALAATLHQIEVDWQRSSTKRPDQALFQLLEHLLKLPTMQQRLEAVVSMAQQFVEPTRTNLYWFEPVRRYFWHRVGNRQAIRSLADSQSSAPGLTVQEAVDFYEALAAGQLIAIGAGRSPFKADVTSRLLSRLRTRSVLAAPILVQKELVGFLAVEGHEARIWEEPEKNYIRAASQLIGLVAGSETTEAMLQQTLQDSALIGEVAGAITSKPDLQIAIKHCADLLLQRLGVERFLLLQAEKEVEGAEVPQLYTVIYQHQPLNRRPLSTSLDVLKSGEGSFLQENAEALAIEDIEQDQRLKEWRESLTSLGVRSLLLSPTGNAPANYLILIAHGTPRTWTQTERRFVEVVSRQIGLLLNALDFKAIAELSSVGYQTLQTGLTTLLNAPSDLAQFDRAWVQYLAQVLEVPLVALLSWMPQPQQTDPQQTAYLQAAAVTERRFALSPNLSIPIASDALIKEALNTNGFLCRSVTDLPPGTRRWLNSPGIGQILIIALHTSPPGQTKEGARSFVCDSVILIADQGERQWPRHLFQSLQILMQQFAYFRHYRRLSAVREREREDLEQLNWYKHRCLENLHQAVASSLSLLQQLEVQEPGQLSNDQSLRRMRSSQILHQLEATLAAFSPLLNEEQWHLTSNLRSVTVTNLLKRSLHRVEPLYEQRQVSIKLHNSGTLNVYGDRIKLECILFELLLTIGYRAQPGNWIDLWCRPSTDSGTIEGNQRLSSAGKLQSGNLQSFLELLIIENEPMNLNASILGSKTLGESDTNPLSSIFSTALEQPPNLHLKICQRILRSWGGDIQFYLSDKSYFISRLLLPLAK